MRPESLQYNWKPRYINSNDLKLVKDLEKLQKKLGLKKSELLRMALINLVKYHNEDKK